MWRRQRGVLGGDDEATRLGDDPPAHERHHESTARAGRARAPAAISSRSPRPSERRDAGAGQGGEPVRRGARTIEPQHLVGEPLDELAARRVGDEPPEAVLPAAFGPGDRGHGSPQQLVGDLDRPGDSCAVVHRLIMPGYASRRAITTAMTPAHTAA